jgi:hypothetical protein
MDLDYSNTLVNYVSFVTVKLTDAPKLDAFNCLIFNILLITDRRFHTR